MKLLTILPNFTVYGEDVPEVDTEYAKFYGIVGQVAEKIKVDRHLREFRITPNSWWLGLNFREVFFGDNFDFISFLTEHAKEEIAEGVLKALNDWTSKFGKIVLIGDDCLKVNDQDLLKEITNSENIKKHIESTEGNLIFLKDISYSEINNLFISEVGHPVKFRKSKIKTWFNLVDNKVFIVKGNKPTDGTSVEANVGDLGKTIFMIFPDDPQYQKMETQVPVKIKLAI